MRPVHTERLGCELLLEHLAWRALDAVRRAGYADEGGSLLELAISAGAGFPDRDVATCSALPATGANPTRTPTAQSSMISTSARCIYAGKSASTSELTPNLQLIGKPGSES